MKIRVADYIVQKLADAGINTCFTVTGGGAMHLNHAFGQNKAIACIYNHHEQASAIAAEGFARTSGQMAAVCVTSGPGGVNAMTGVMGAYLDSVPMVVISGQVKYTTTVDYTGMALRQFGDQEYDIVKSVSRMTKYAEMVKKPADIRRCVEKALHLADTGRKGPCWLDIPLDIQGATIETDALAGFTPETLVYDNIDDKVDALIGKLQTAKRPVILGGTAIMQSHSYAKFMQLIQKLNIPVTTAWNAHDLMPDEHPLYAGRPGSVGDRAGNFAIGKADLILVLGCRLNIRQISYNFESFGADAEIVMVDIDKAELNKPSLSLTLPIHADLHTFFDAMLAKDFKLHNDYSAWIAWCKKLQANYPVVTEAMQKDKLNVYCFIDALFKKLVPGDVTVCSNGSACVCSFQAAIIKPNQRLFTNSGCAAMGYGLPAAIGACFSQGKAKTICIEGDGSLQMNLQELQLLVHHKLPIKLFVINNQGYHSIRQSQSNMYKGDPMHGVGAASGVSFPNLQKLAGAYGIDYMRLTSVSDIDATLDDKLQSDKPCIIEAVVGTDQAFEPKLAAIRREDGSIYSPPIYDLSPQISRDELNEILKSI